MNILSTYYVLVWISTLINELFFFSGEESLAREKAREKFSALVQNLIKIKRKSAGTRDDTSDPLAIWASEADQSELTADWCSFLRVWVIGKPVVSSRTLNVRKRSGSGNSL